MYSFSSYSLFSFSQKKRRFASFASQSNQPIDFQVKEGDAKAISFASPLRHNRGLRHSHHVDDAAFSGPSAADFDPTRP